MITRLFTKNRKYQSLLSSTGRPKKDHRSSISPAEETPSTLRSLSIQSFWRLNCGLEVFRRTGAYRRSRVAVVGSFNPDREAGLGARIKVRPARVVPRLLLMIGSEPG